MKTHLFASDHTIDARVALVSLLILIAALIAASARGSFPDGRSIALGVSGTDVRLTCQGVSGATGRN